MIIDPILSEVSLNLWVDYLRGSLVGFFNPVIPTQNFVQSCNPEGYFWHPTSRVYFQSRISSRFCFQIPNPELQIREIPDPEKPIGDPHLRVIRTRNSQACEELTDWRSDGLSQFDKFCKAVIVLIEREEQKCYVRWQSTHSFASVGTDFQYLGP